MTDKIDVADWKKQGGRISEDDAEVIPLEPAEAERQGAPFAVPRTYTLEDLDADRRRELLALADLPEGHGWGAEMDRILGGGLAPGDVLALGASSAGAGKTAFLMQLADGLALRSANLADTMDGSPLTPMILLSEMAPSALARRTLGRLTGAPSWFFRSGKAAERSSRKGEAENAYREAEALLAPGGLFSRLSAWQRVARPESRGCDLLGQLKTSAEGFRADVEARYPGREVWPVVVIDPIQRWQDPKLSEVEALNVLAEEIDALADANGWIVLLTSDTNKAAAKGAEEADTSPAGLFRGSYKLFHSCDVILAYTADKAQDGEKVRGVTLEVAKNRNGQAFRKARFAWTLESGRFAALPDGEAPPSRGSAETRKERSPDA